MRNSILFAVIICLIQSCTDSLGIDPKYQVAPLNPEETLGDSSPNQFPIDSIVPLKLLEYYQLINVPESWQLLNKWIKSEIKMDTTNSKVRIWMKLNLSNPSAGNPMTSQRKDRLIAFQLSFRAILQENKTYTLTGNPDSWKWASVVIETKTSDLFSSFKTYDGSQIISEISFQNIDKDNINLQIKLDFSPLGILETQKFEGLFDVHKNNN